MESEFNIMALAVLPRELISVSPDLGTVQYLAHFRNLSFLRNKGNHKMTTYYYDARKTQSSKKAP